MPSPEPVVIPLRDRREHFAAALELLTQGFAAFTILSAGLDALRAAGADRTLGYVELAAGVLLLGAIVREVRALRRGEGQDAAVSWVNLFAAAVIFVEVWQRVDAGGKFSRPTFLTGVITLLMGFVQPRLVQRRARKRLIRMDGEGVAYRAGPLRRFDLQWSQVESVALEPARLRFHLAGGRKRSINLRFLHNGAEVAAAVADAAARAGVRTLGPAASVATAPDPSPPPGPAPVHGCGLRAPLPRQRDSP
ncbi:MAG TPA: hypothetical protein VF746_15940 [Longimicrobium sp.]